MLRIGRANTIFLVAFLLAELFFTYTSMSWQGLALPNHLPDRHLAEKWWQMEEALALSTQKEQSKETNALVVADSQQPSQKTLLTRTDDNDDASLASSSSTTTSTSTVLTDSKPGKPFIVLHYGPAKTGTSTLQNEMSVWKDQILQLDNVLYGGAYYIPGTFMGRLDLQLEFMDLTLTCSRAMAEARMEWQAQTSSHNGTVANNTPSLAKTLRENVPCARALHESLAPYHANGTSLIFSNEVKSTVMNWKVLPGYAHKVPQDWYSLAALLSDDWNVVLVLGHRPFLDWLPSAKNQVDKYKPSKPKLSLWPIAGGNPLRTLFPPETLVGSEQTLWDVDAKETLLKHRLPKIRYNRKKFQEWKGHWNRNVLPFMHSSMIHGLTQSYIPIRFLHLHDDVPIRTNFLCNILHDITPNACAASRQADETQPSALAHMNAGRKHANRIWYDHLSVQAVDEGLVDYKVLSRAAVTEACQHYHETVKNRTLLDLPHHCPSPRALRALWDYSWDKEVTMLGAAHANWTRHVQIFRHNLAQGKYCNIDAAAAVQQTEWRNFFQKLATKTTKKQKRKK